MQNDGYIVGTAKAEVGRAAAIILVDSNELIDSNKLFETPNYSLANFNVSLFIQKGKTIYTRDDYGTYNLTVYEYKINLILFI